MRVVAARVADAEALTDLHLDVWEEAYADLVPATVLTARRAGRAERVERWRTSLSGVHTTLLARSPSADLLGFSSTGTGRDPDDGLPPLELMALYVRASSYGTGVGRALLREAVGEAPCYLWVLDGATKQEDVGLERRMVRRG